MVSAIQGWTTIFKINLFIIVGFFFFFFLALLGPCCGVKAFLVGLSCPVACGILVPQPSIEPVSSALESVLFLTTGLPGESLIIIFIESQDCWVRDLQKPPGTIFLPFWKHTHTHTHTHTHPTSDPTTVHRESCVSSDQVSSLWVSLFPDVEWDNQPCLILWC